MSQPDARPEAPRPGFRLVRFEVLNWGTFHKQVWGLDLRGDNALLTGDIGSGKSTLVDAITALLVPRANFNKAAGAIAGERNTETYFFGRYKAERGEPGLSARPVSLRGADSYSVLLARFFNEALAQEVTLAQLFWAKAPQGAPSRIYVLADRALSIREHFAGFGQDINTLRKRLRAMEKVEIHDTFPPYGSAYRHRFGIENDQAMDLFHQTISMKSVGNLTEFVRDHMLEPSPVDVRIQALIRHYQDLDRAHELVQKARFQIGFLEPLVAECDQRDGLAAEVNALRTCRDALRPWFAVKKRDLLEKRLRNLDAELAKLAHRIRAAEELSIRQEEEREIKRQAVREHGGDRIEQIKREVGELTRQKDERQRRGAAYDARARALGLAAAADADIFLANRRAIQGAAAAAGAEQAEAQNALTEASVEVRQLQDRYEELGAEVKSLRSRRSNIPRYILELRTEMCNALDLSEDKVPFVGELLQVQLEERGWEGAIERLLHSFGLSLLVADVYYESVAEWVERTHLGGRLVYFRVLPAKTGDRSALDRASLVRKIAIKPKSEFYVWLNARLTARFNYVCCDTLEQFRREPFAITRAGQVKGNEHHEKDDRYRIDDRSRYVLGWSNTEKIQALLREQKNLEAQSAPLVNRIEKFKQRIETARNRQSQLDQLAVYESFLDLDWRPLVSQIERLESERQKLEDGSDVLKTLQEQLRTIEAELTATAVRLRADQAEQTRLNERQQVAKELAAQCDAIVAASADTMFSRLEAMSVEAIGVGPLTIESCDSRERDMRDWLQKGIDSEDAKLKRLGERIVKAMQSYRSKYPLETQEADASVEAAAEFRAILKRLLDDDLPRFEQQFKNLLTENTIREVANFQSQLHRERETIRDRIDIINRSLRGIDYNPGRYILLEPDPNPDQEIRDFVASLRACTEGSLAGSDEAGYSEEKFVQVKQIIERFRGREGNSEIDRRWTAKVTDVRQWFTFSASERWREDAANSSTTAIPGGSLAAKRRSLHTPCWARAWHTSSVSRRMCRGCVLFVLSSLTKRSGGVRMNRRATD